MMRLKLTMIMTLLLPLVQASTGMADLKEQVSDGQRLALREKGFSIKPLPGWKVVEGDPGVSLILEAPEPRNSYQPTIQINTFAEPIYMDDYSSERLRKWFHDQLKTKEAVLEGLSERDHQKVTMANGSQGLLFFFEFTARGKPMIQVNLVASGKDRHYIMTYNDLRANFDLEGETGGYEAAWNIMSSIEPSSQIGKRYDNVVAAGAAVAGVVILLALFFAWRYWRATSMLREFDVEDPSTASNHGESDGSQHESGHSREIDPEDESEGKSEWSLHKKDQDED